jgi:hypothetical protein
LWYKENRLSDLPEPTRSYLDLLDEDALPQNGDVALVLSQVVAAMKAFHSKYYAWDGQRHIHRWFVERIEKQHSMTD